MTTTAPTVTVRWARDVPEASAIGAVHPYDVAVVPGGMQPGDVTVAVVEPAERTRATLRRAAGTATRRARDVARAVSAGSVRVDLGDDDAIAEGALLGWYRYNDPDDRLDVGRSPVADAVIQARDWVTAPPNRQSPARLAESFAAYAGEHGLTCEIHDEAALEAAGYEGILAVGAGSARPPRLVRLAYDPGSGPHLALVGKGITFDSGGLDLKPAAGMVSMRHDMAGSAAVVAAIGAIARLGLQTRVTAYAPLAENMPSGTAFRPSDVLTLYGGTTVESGNTDAEGRLVLAEALVRAAEDHPDLLVDVATLTGAVVAALGTRTSGLFTRSDSDADRLLAAAEAAGERMWRLPIGEENVEGLESPVADLRSVSADHPAGASFAAAFLSHFVADDRAWAHLDVAGVSWNAGAAYAHVPPMGTGAVVATLVELARSMA